MEKGKIVVDGDDVKIISSKFRNKKAGKNMKNDVDSINEVERLKKKKMIEEVELNLIPRRGSVSGLNLCQLHAGEFRV